MSRVRIRPRGFLADVRGVAAAEMALVLPIAALITLNVVDLATYMYSRMQVDLAAQQAVGVVRQLCTANPVSVCNTTYSTQMTAAAQTTGLGNAVTLAGAQTSEGLYCASATGALTSVAAGTANCASVVSGSTAAPGTYLKVQSQYTFAPIFPQVSLASILGSPVVSTAWIRLK
ncbi:MULTISPECIES: TadE/TadG family type IV pilus assembly protein [unclassified Sphingomonas]|uniref:TadE/TadG family type IV pilus assembly protein n=1 Tax=unclassified Sphingomonas TaxID=196159 RepID=UPI00092BFAC0|nr:MULTISPECIES: TadE/TadG family type IV pilus assembly protein [unclassified Sphingomonas]MBN8848540.1 pilus assembly protein [Sphingomonas sp.]OJV30692.1 MAG: hypothetical protein BGO24_08240 [Sphingomonas sp. 67-36]